MVEIMTKKRVSDRIDEERVCVDSFVQHLKEMDNRQEITVCKEPNDPPDFWVIIAGMKYAVEVTSIVTDADYYEWCRELAETIRLECKENNDIKGTYALSIIRRPHIPKKGTTDWRTLVSTAVIKIREMSDAPQEAESYLLKGANGYIEIQRLSDKGSKIGLFMLPTMKWESEVQEELSQLIKKAIEKKRERLYKKQEQLEKKGVLDWDPTIILVFYDAYGYCDIDDVKQAFLKVQGYGWLHSIFIATSFSDTKNILYPDSPGRKGVFLYSKNEQWCC